METRHVSTRTETRSDGKVIVTTEETITKADGTKIVNKTVEERIVNPRSAERQELRDDNWNPMDQQEERFIAKKKPFMKHIGAKDESSSKKSQKMENFISESVHEHNLCRAKHGAPPLMASSELSKYAQKHADTLAAKNRMYHSDCTLKNSDKVGENVATRWSSAGPHVYTAADFVSQWYDEVSSYKDYSGRSGMQGAGHFTQVVWKDSREIGIGRGIASNGAVFVVATYRPAGNYVGRFAENVFPAR